MAKSIKIFRIQFGNNTAATRNNSLRPHIHKHSMYLQSKDIDWINKNSKNNYEENDGQVDKDIQD